MTLSRKHPAELSRLIKGSVSADVPLSRHTSFRIGGPADLLVRPKDVRDLQSVLRYLNERDIGWFILGAGTNVLFHDKGFRGAVIPTKSMTGYCSTTNGSDHMVLTAEAGFPLPALVYKAADLGLRGLEPLWGIPGSFGGAIAVNAGAGGTSTAEFLQRVRILTRDGDEIDSAANEIEFGYRRAAFPTGSIILSGTVRLMKGDRSAIEAALAARRNERRATQPAERRSAGCVFKNPPGQRPAGALIDGLGFKGYSIGDAQVSEIHANFIINRGKATAGQVLELIETIKQRVKAETGIDLEPEIRIVGEGGESVL
ncbi:MAG: UDP-N-acetylmuramate dehydrogenase [Pseudomonadota bacterium]